jgi:hypothetical protein
MAYYKVVRRLEDRRLVSVIVNPVYLDFYRVYQTPYKANKKVKHGLAFDNLSDAKGFAEQEQRLTSDILEIWTCSGRKIRLPRLAFNLNVASTNVTEALRILKKVLFHGGWVRWNEQDIIQQAHYSFPYGTVRLRDLKLKEKVS